LWSREAEAGETERRKDRPCVIITAIRRAAAGRLRVRVLPITHRPTEESRGIAIPPKVKRHLGLDADAPLSARAASACQAARQSALWIVLDEANEFYWPEVDLRPVSRSKPRVWTFGILPMEIFDEIQARLRTLLEQRRAFRTD
jgi:hypothetical protein